MSHLAALPWLQIAAVSGLALAVCALVAAFVLAAARRRDRAQIELLLARLAELEELLPTAVAEEGEAGVLAAVVDPAGLAGVELEPAARAAAPSADVLAGRSSYVQRAVTGAGAEVATLAGQAIACVHRHLAETLAPADLAEELHISLRTLERGLAASLCCSPTQLIVAMKMREARRLLQTGTLRVNEVAFRLGFSSPYHFSRRFKEFYRVSPSEVARRDSAA